jgi:ribokinase
MGRVLVVGSSNYDLVWRCERLPQKGETVAGNSFATFMGGKGANQAVACARAGAEVAFCGCVGRDSFGDQMRAAIESAGVDVGHLSRSDTPSGTAAVLVEDSAANQIVVALGANLELSGESVEAAVAQFRPEYILAQMEIPLEALRAASRLGAKFVLNPAPAQALDAELVSQCYAVVPNESELNLVVPGLFGDDAVEALLQMGAQNVVVTLGEKGAVWATATTLVEVDGYPMAAVDTVGAGDVFCGAMVAALSNGETFESAVRFANAAAGISVTRHGAQASAPERAEVLALMMSQQN